MEINIRDAIDTAFDNVLPSFTHSRGEFVGIVMSRLIYADRIEVDGVVFVRQASHPYEEVGTPF